MIMTTLAVQQVICRTIIFWIFRTHNRIKAPRLPVTLSAPMAHPSVGAPTKEWSLTAAFVLV